MWIDLYKCIKNVLCRSCQNVQYFAKRRKLSLTLPYSLALFRLASIIPLFLFPSSFPTSLPPPPTAFRLGGALARFFFVFLEGLGRSSMYDGTGHPEVRRTFAILGSERSEREIRQRWSGWRSSMKTRELGWVRRDEVYINQSD